MITFKEKLYTHDSGHILYIHGLNSHGHDDVWKGLQKYMPEFQIDTFDHPGDPQETKKIIDRIDLRSYQGIIGHSLGALWAMTCPLREIPLFLINPGLGIHYKLPVYTDLENQIYKCQHNNVYGFFGTKDPHLKMILGNYKEHFKPNPNIIYYPGGHVPSETMIKDYIVPEIKKVYE